MLAQTGAKPPHHRLNFGHRSFRFEKGIPEQRSQQQGEGDKIQQQIERQAHGEKETVVVKKIVERILEKKPKPKRRPFAHE